LPRKYRPPAARRRKSKRQAPVFVEPLPDNDNETPAADGASASVLEEVEPDAVMAAAIPKPAPAQPPAADRAPAAPAKHIAKDYSYVRAEVRRIAVVAGFLIISLIITALLRN
jgi:hypothetical protein